MPSSSSADWAWEADMRHMCPNADEELARWWGERCRAATSPGAARALIEMNSLVDVREVLGCRAGADAGAASSRRRRRTNRRGPVSSPTASPARRSSNSTARDHFVAVDPDQILDPIEEFVRGLGPAGPSESSLATVLAVDVAEQLDLAWVRSLVREVLDEYRGVVATADDPSVLATFDGPGRAVRCGLALVDRAAVANLHLSVGVHTAEVARRGAEIWGDGVGAAREVAGRAEWGEVWVTPTVRALTDASELSYDRRGSFELPSLKRSLELDAVR